MTYASQIYHLAFLSAEVKKIAINYCHIISYCRRYVPPEQVYIILEFVKFARNSICNFLKKTLDNFFLGSILAFMRVKNGSFYGQDWFGFYNPYPKDMVVPDSFIHPAKMSWDLCHRIFTRLEELGLPKGAKILDPFAGIFTTGLVGGLRGYWVSGMELEPRFFDLANKNILKNKHKLAAWPEIKCGDSCRDLLSTFGGEKFQAVIGSPVFGQANNGGGIAKALAGESNYPISVRGGKYQGFQAKHQLSSPGQMANLSEGNFDAVISSPPYSEALIGKRSGASGVRRKENYGDKKEQLANIPEGDFSAVVSSPPFQRSEVYTDKEFIKKMRPRQHIAISPDSEGQLQNVNDKTYWSACRDIYCNCFLLLKSGGFIALVIKDFVRKRERVPLCDRTWRLLQAVGFEPVERNRAWLVEEQEAPTFFDGNHKVKKERKSFFRRLVERQGSPKIDWEEILILKK